MDDNNQDRTEGQHLDRLYRVLLRLYPAGFRDRLGEEMVATFAEARAAARATGRDAEARLLMRELLAFPGNLLLAYARSWQALQPQPASGPPWPWVAGWTGAGCAVAPVAWLLAAPLGMLFLFFLRLSGAPAALSSNEITMLGFVTGLGLTSTMLQWLLLRPRLPHAGWWIPVTFAGWLAAGLLLFTLDRLFQLWLQAPLTGLALLGITVGIAQWLLLRRLLPRAGWWPLVSLLAYSSNLLIGKAITSLAELFIILMLPHLILGTALWLLLRQASPSAPAVQPQKTAPRSLPGWLRRVAIALLLLLPLLVVGPWVYAKAQLELAKRDGIYASPEEGFRILAADVQGAELLRIADLESGPSRGDGRLPHVGFAAGRVYYDRPPTGWDESSGYPGSYYIRVRGGWVHMSEGVFPPLVGRIMEIYHLEGAGE